MQIFKFTANIIMGEFLKILNSKASIFIKKAERKTDKSRKFNRFINRFKKFSVSQNSVY